MWSLMDDKHSVYVPHHDGLLVDMVSDGLDEEIDGMAADFAMRLKEVILSEYIGQDNKEVKQLSVINANGE